MSYHPQLYGDNAPIILQPNLTQYLLIESHYLVNCPIHESFEPHRLPPATTTTTTYQYLTPEQHIRLKYRLDTIALLLTGQCKPAPLVCLDTNSCSPDQYLQVLMCNFDPRAGLFLDPVNVLLATSDRVGPIVYPHATPRTCDEAEKDFVEQTLRDYNNPQYASMSFLDVYEFNSHLLPSLKTTIWTKLSLPIMVWILLGIAIPSQNIRLLAFLMNPFPSEHIVGRSDWKRIKRVGGRFQEISDSETGDIIHDDDGEGDGGDDDDDLHLTKCENYQFTLQRLRRAQAFLTASPQLGGIDPSQWELDIECLGAALVTPTTTTEDTTTHINIENALNGIPVLLKSSPWPDLKQLGRGQEKKKETNITLPQSIASALFRLSPPHFQSLSKNPEPWIVPLLQLDPANVNILMDAAAIIHFDQHLVHINPTNRRIIFQNVLFRMTRDKNITIPYYRELFWYIGGWWEFIPAITNVEPIWGSIIQHQAVEMYQLLTDSPYPIANNNGSLPNKTKWPILSYFDSCNPYHVIDKVLTGLMEWDFLSTSTTTNTSTTTTTTNTNHPSLSFSYAILSHPRFQITITSPCQRIGVDHTTPSTDPSSETRILTTINYRNLLEAYFYNSSPLCWPLSQLFPSLFPLDIDLDKWLSTRFWKRSRCGELEWAADGRGSILATSRALFTRIYRDQGSLHEKQGQEQDQSQEPSQQQSQKTPRSPFAMMDHFDINQIVHLNITNISGFLRLIFLENGLFPKDSKPIHRESPHSELSKLNVAIPLPFALLGVGARDFDKIIEVMLGMNFPQRSDDHNDGDAYPAKIQLSTTKQASSTAIAASNSLINLGTILDFSSFSPSETFRIPPAFNLMQLCVWYSDVEKAADNAMVHIIEYQIKSIMNHTHHLTFAPHVHSVQLIDVDFSQFKSVHTHHIKESNFGNADGWSTASHLW